MAENINIKIYTEIEQKKQGHLFGVFFEDLNHAADGGLYAELIQNRSFEFNQADRNGYHGLTGWEVVERGDSVAFAHVESLDPAFPENPHYLLLEVTMDGLGGGISNEGFTGIFCQEGAQYRFSCYYRLRDSAPVPFMVRLEDEEEECLAEASFIPEEGDWNRFVCTLTAAKTTDKAKLVMFAMEPVTIAFDMVSLFPVDTFRGRENGLRKDIAQLIEDMKPKFMRFPGGCLTHMGSLNSRDRSAMYRWKNTLGPVENRPARSNNWQYNQTVGLGFYEYFLFCEDIGAEPLPVIAGGYDPHALRIAPLDKMQEWIDEALDLIEFANGEIYSKWGGLRAQMGHPESFHLKYLAIGNEEVGDDFFDRYEIMLRAIKEKYPEIQVITSAGAGSAGSEFDKGWAQAKRTDTSYVDEHFYQCPEWFIANADRYADYEVQPRAFLGEYASKGVQWKNALAEAAFMTGMEKAPGVGLACYAPMLCNLNYVNWKPDMIYFDQSRAYGSPSYYVQKLFMNYQGEALLQTEDTLVHKETSSPRLTGKIGMQTQNAIVDISDFTYTDLRSGEEIKVPAFTLSPENTLVECLDGRAEDYSISFSFIKKNGGRARNLAGSHSFCLDFARGEEGDPGKEDRLSWSIDGWQRHHSVSGYCGAHLCDMGLYLFESKLDTRYQAKLVVKNGVVQTYIDGVLYCNHRVRTSEAESLYYSAVKETDGIVIVKVVNVQDAEKQIHIELEGMRKFVSVKIAAMENFELEDTNSLEEPQKVSPTEKELPCMGNSLHYVLPGHSFAVLRFQPQEAEEYTPMEEKPAKQ